LQAEIEALRVAARILEGGTTTAPIESARPMAVQPAAAPVAAVTEKKRVWP
jgi:hypothetical protein